METPSTTNSTQTTQAHTSLLERIKGDPNAPHNFPRMQWPTKEFSVFPVPPSDRLAFIRWAARNATKSWVMAASERNLRGVDSTVFKLAVVDKVFELFRYATDPQRFKPDPCSTVTEWRQETDELIAAVYLKATQTLPPSHRYVRKGPSPVLRAKCEALARLALDLHFRPGRDAMEILTLELPALDTTQLGPFMARKPPRIRLHRKAGLTETLDKTRSHTKMGKERRRAAANDPVVADLAHQMLNTTIETGEMNAGKVVVEG